MNILVMSDEEAKNFWDYYKPGAFKDIDLIISAGDLKAEYLTFIETVSNLPLLYVHGNHDEKYTIKPPEGCICIEDDVYVHESGLRIAGLGGSMRYREGYFQYNEKDMQRRVRRLKRKIWHTKGFDILVTHAPLAGFHDDPNDRCHTGFEAFRGLLAQYQPQFFIHGHVHMNYGIKTPRLSQYQDTVVINAYRYHIFNPEDPNVRKEASKHAVPGIAPPQTPGNRLVKCIAGKTKALVRFFSKKLAVPDMQELAPSCETTAPGHSPQ